jgi:dTDP-4-dehydrorhamnose 3,5-epimerase
MGGHSRTAGPRRRSPPQSRPRAPRFSPAEGFVRGARKDGRTILPDWTPLRELIAGVRIQEVRHVPKGRGHLTEIYRRDWGLDDAAVDQVFQVWLGPGEISAWHAHRRAHDRLFVNHGLIRILLYDARTKSPSFRRLNQLSFGTPRPALVTVPPGVWHGLQNISSEPSAVLNLVDRAYTYDDPDHWRLPQDTKRIPYRFEALTSTPGRR